MRPWNKNPEGRAFWDPNTCKGRGGEVIKVSTLKSRLESPSGMAMESLLIDVALGLAMVMNAIEENDPKEVDISEMDKDEEEQ